MPGLAAALVAAQTKFPAIEKTGKSNFGAHVTLDHLIEGVRPVLNENGLAVLQFPSFNELGQPTLVTRLLHESGESMEYAMPLMVAANVTMQGFGAALTYARRYALAAALGIASDEDDDGDSEAEAAKKAAAAKAKRDAKPKPEPAAPKGPRTISDNQRTRLFALAGELSVDVTTVRQIVEKVTGQDSTKQIPAGQYDEICGLIEKAANDAAAKKAAATDA